jgi:hypothetical protein
MEVAGRMYVFSELMGFPDMHKGSVRSGSLESGSIPGRLACGQAMSDLEFINLMKIVVFVCRIFQSCRISHL